MKKTLTIFSLHCCGGCSQEFLSDYQSIGQLADCFDITEPDDYGHDSIDVALVEGHLKSEKEEKNLKLIRKIAKTVVAIGACAHLSGVGSQKKSTKTVSDVIKVDYIIPGCPISKKELYHCLMDLYWGKKFTLPDLAVCFECRQNGNKCLLKDNKICLGPITRMGCDSICVNNGEACLGCRGHIPAPNIEKIKEALHPIVQDEAEIDHLLSFYGNQNE